MRIELRKQVVAELRDSTFQQYTHGRKHTSDKGCKGPLCKKAARDRGRNRHRRKRAAAGMPMSTRWTPSWRDVFLAHLQTAYERGQLR